MTSELRPAVDVWAKAHAAYQSSVMAYAGTLCVKAVDLMKPATVIQAYGDEREAKGRAEQAAELAKFKALAETLAGALHHRGGPLCPARYYGDAQCTCGVAEALRQYKEAHDV